MQAVLVRAGKLEETFPAGYQVRSAPRRSARGRAGETLVLALDAIWKPLSDSQAQLLCELASRAYFDTPGSVTAALRESFTAVNDEIFQGAQDLAGLLNPQNPPLQLNMAIAVLHEEALFLGWTGEVLILVASQGFVGRFPAAGEKPGRPLGSSRTPELHYGHIALAPGAAAEPYPTLLLSGAPAVGWRNALDNAARLSLHAVAERMSQAPSEASRDLAAILVRLVPEAAARRAIPVAGAGLPRILVGSREQSQPIPSGKPLPATGQARAGPGAPSDQELQREQKAASLPAGPRKPLPAEEAAEESAPPVAHVHPSAAAAGLERARSAGAGSMPKVASRLNVISGLRSFARASRVSVQAGWRAVRAGLDRLTPEGTLSRDRSVTLSPRLMLATAILVPLVVVTVVGILYYQRGRSEQYGLLVEQVRASAQVAAGQSDPALARQQWGRVLALVNQASQYGQSGELATIRNQGTHALDVLDGITPLDFHPLIPDGLGAGTRVTAMVVGDREIFALDENRGEVLRLVIGEGGYQLDDSFRCQAGDYPEHSVATPVDIVWVPDITVGSQVPSSARSGVLVAVDSRGGVLYCPPGGTALAGALTPPRTGWLSLRAIDYYNGKLYALDPTGNGFWRFPTSGFTFDQPPDGYFNAAVPNLTDVVDFVVASGEVFFLHADGHLTRCAYNPLFSLPGNAGTGANVCGDMAYNDTRPGRKAGARLADAQITQLRYSPPPEPSLFFLDSFGRGSFRFSLALDFLAHYRVTAALRGDASALAVGEDKTLFLAVGDQIYSAATTSP